MDDKPYIFLAMQQANEQAKRDINEDSEIAKRWINERGSIAIERRAAQKELAGMKSRRARSLYFLI